MTAPQTPHGEPPHDPSPSHGGGAPGRPSPAEGGAAPSGRDVAQAHGEEERAVRLRADVRRAAVAAVAVALAGVLLGLLWLWLSPRLSLVSDGKAVFFRNSEGEEAVGTDGTFLLLALGFGTLTGVAGFLARREGGVLTVVALAVGGLLGAVVAWRVGVWLGPSQDVVARAREAGEGKPFEAPLQLRAKGALLAWPIAAMAVHLGLTALFGSRDEEEYDPEAPPHWTPSHQSPPR